MVVKKVFQIDDVKHFVLLCCAHKSMTIIVVLRGSIVSRFSGEKMTSSTSGVTHCMSTIHHFIDLSCKQVDC